MTERAFALIPLQEIAGDIIIPGIRRSINELIAHLPSDQVVRQLEIPFHIDQLSPSFK
jgi:7,8-dihydro-6-hydroxymethylpterin-pyrophosphokinase